MSKDKRRQYGSGGIHQRKSDGMWVGTIEAGYTPKGTRRRVTVSATTEAACRRKLGEKQKQIAKEGLPGSAAASTTVRTYADEWLQLRAKKVRPKTYITDAGIVRKWIVPTIGRRRLSAVEPRDVRAVIDAQRQHPHKASSLLRTHTTLIKMLKDARSDGHSILDRTIATEKPSTGTRDVEAIPPDDARALLTLAFGQPDGSRWLTAFMTGARRSEVLGLTWACVDFNRNVLVVDWQLQSLPYNIPHDRKSGFRIPDGYEAKQLEGALHLVRPKTQAGHREVPMPPPVRYALERWRKIAPASRHDLVWPRKNGAPRSHSEWTEEWKQLQDAARVAYVDGEHGRRYKLNEARHATATMLMAQRVDPQVITAIMGHSSMVSTKAYKDATLEHAREALEDATRRWAELEP